MFQNKSVKYSALSTMDSYSSYQGGGPSGESEFQKLSSTITTNIQKISQNVTSLHRMINQLGTNEDTQMLRDKLHQIQHYTGQLAKDTSIQLKELQSIPLPPSASDQKQRKLQRERLTHDFTSVLNRLQQEQRNAAQKEKDSVKRARASSGGTGFDQSPDPLIDLGPGQGHGASTQIQIEDNVDMEGLREREKAIRQLESDICDVNQIFKDLAAMVHDQGEMVDSIEANVETAQVQVSEGAQQLARAAQYSSSARKKKFFLIIFLVIVAAIIIGIIAWQAS